MSVTGSITKQVMEEIYKSDLIIANLTNRNPNVMYELAFRHCLGKPVIQIAEDGTDLPFDIGTERTIPYVNDSKGVLELIEKIIKFENEINYDEKNQGPIYDVLKNIEHEIQIFSAIDASSGNSENGDILKYILHRIDKIDKRVEDAINSKNIAYRSEFSRVPFDKNEHSFDDSNSFLNTKITIVPNLLKD